MIDESLASAITAWRAGDCDTDDVAALDELVQAANLDDDLALTQLKEAFSGDLEFGTAGLRGRMAPGPNRMNTAVVRRAAYALAHTVATQSRLAVIGYDARHRSQTFAIESARVLAAAGWQPRLLPRALPTPVLAFAVRHLHADLGIMVTASHNPPADNGYKVYLADGRQIIEPIDADIAAAIRVAPDACDIDIADSVEYLDDRVVDAYVDTAARVVAESSSRSLTVVHTSLHGVATETFAAAMDRAGFEAPIEVGQQRDPNPDFPTVAFPNPEEPGAMDLLMQVARTHDANIAIAHDPDADRCAAAIPTETGWRMLTGDEVGAVLGWWLLHRAQTPAVRGTYAASLVSGTRVARIAEDAGVPFTTTLTGFKWISRVPDLAYGYEEALGYCVDPAHVADKDGITAGLLLCEVAATLRARGSDLSGLLDQLDRQFGVEMTGQVSIRFARADSARTVTEHLTAQPPTDIADMPVAEVLDLARGFAHLPPTPGVAFLLDDPTGHGAQARVIVRPSGTEPKVKAYLQVQFPQRSDVAHARQEARRLLQELEMAVPALLEESAAP